MRRHVQWEGEEGGGREGEVEGEEEAEKNTVKLFRVRKTLKGK